MHDEIVRFHLEGTIADNNIVSQKEKFVGFLEGNMRSEGCVPALDLSPQFTLDYKPESETYEFELTVYGVHVGMDKSRAIAGVDSGRYITNSSYVI